MQKKVYSAKINKWIYAAIPLVALLTIPFIVQSIIYMVKMSSFSENYLLYVDIHILLVIVLTVVLGLSISCILFARYVVSNRSLYIRIGVFYNKIETKHICEISFYRCQNKLVLFYKNIPDEVKQIVINIHDDKFDDFVNTLKKSNSSIIYSIQSQDEE